MPDVQEVFRMATQKVRPDPGALERQHRNQRWQVTKRRTGVYGVVAGLVIAGLVIGVAALRNGDDGTVTPAVHPSLTRSELAGIWRSDGGPWGQGCSCASHRTARSRWTIGGCSICARR